MVKRDSARVSAVILAFNRAEAVEVVLDRLRNLPLHEVILVDSGTDGTGELAEARGGVRVVRTGNIGISARNVAASQAEGDLLLMLDDDSYPLPGAIEIMRETFARQPTLGALGGFVRDVATDGSVVATDGLGSFDWFQRAGRAGAPAEGLPAFFFPEGACMFRREAFEEAGGWFEPYFLTMTELDLATRMIGAGWDVRYQPQARFDHMKAEGGLRGAARTLRFRVRNQIWYFALRFPPAMALRRIVAYLAFDLIEAANRGIIRDAWTAGIRQAWSERRLVSGMRRALPRATLRRAELNRGRLHLRLLAGQLRRRVAPRAERSSRA